MVTRAWPVNTRRWSIDVSVVQRSRYADFRWKASVVGLRFILEVGGRRDCYTRNRLATLPDRRVSRSVRNDVKS